MLKEQWRSVAGFEGLYEVSDMGRVRSLHRVEPRVLKPGSIHTGHLMVWLCSGGTRKAVTIHRLVLQTFVGSCPEGHECCHRDGNPTNNRVENLYWGTRSQNVLDAVRHGTHTWSRRTHCKHGHEFTPDNTRVQKDGSRRCVTCDRMSGRKFSKKKWATYTAERTDFVDRRHDRKPHCNSGRHLWSEQTPYVSASGKRECRLCRNERKREAAARSREQVS
jgi:hypothetical protein